MRAPPIAISCVLLCSSALGQPAGPTYVPPPSGGSYGPPPYAYGPYGAPPPGWGPPPVDPTAHRHDGFYLRMGIGLGYGRATTTGTISGSETKATYSGTGPAFEFMLGGTVARGLVIGAGLLELDILNPSIDVESNDPTLQSNVSASTNSMGIGALGFNTFGPFIDWFPSDTGGAHVGGMLGLGVIHLEGDVGVGGSLWTGYDFWVGQQWSLGAELRGTLANGTRDAWLSNGRVEFKDFGGTLELLFTALLH